MIIKRSSFSIYNITHKKKLCSICCQTPHATEWCFRLLLRSIDPSSHRVLSYCCSDRGIAPCRQTPSFPDREQYFSAPGVTNGFVPSMGWRVICIPNLVEGPQKSSFVPKQVCFVPKQVDTSNQWILHYRKRRISHPSIYRLQISHLRTRIKRESASIPE